MPGKPFQSKRQPFEAEIFALLNSGKSFREAAQLLNAAYGLSVTHDAVFSFVKARSRSRDRLLFYEGLSPDIRGRSKRSRRPARARPIGEKKRIENAER